MASRSRLPGGELVDVAVAAQGLDRLERHPRRLLGGEEDGAGGVLAAGLAPVARARHGVDIGAGRVHRRVHVRDLALHELEGADGPAELLALVDVGQHDVHAGAHDPQGPGGEHGALVVEPAHQHAHATADLADHVLRRHLAVLEHQLAGVRPPHAELVELLGGGEAGHALLDQEGGDAAAAGVGVGLGVDHEDLGVRPVGDPHLRPVEDVAIALALGPRAHAHHVRARARLAHGERADMLARDQLGQVAGALGLRAVEPDLVDAEVGVRAVAEADRGGGPAHLLHGDAVLQVAEAAAAFLLLHGDAEQAEVAKVRPEVARELVARVDLFRARRDLRLREALDRRADHVGRLAEPEIQAGHSIGGHFVGGSCRSR